MTQSGVPSDRRLCVFEANVSNPDHGRILAIPPNQATGIPLPTAKITNQLPAAGSVAGEIVFERTTRTAFIWDGNQWSEVTASPIVRKPDDAAVIADTTQAIGTYAVSGSTGNLYVFTATGWQRIGTQEYATAADLLADTPAVGTMGLALDEESLWEHTPNGWRTITLRQFPNTRAVFGWNLAEGGHTGDRALASDIDVIYIRTASGWRPSSIWEASEAQIKAAKWATNGQQAVAMDTGNIFVYVGEAWSAIPAPNLYANDAAMTADAPNLTDGDYCVNQATGVGFVYVAAIANFVSLGEVNVYATDAERSADSPPQSELGVVGTIAAGTWYERTGGQWMQDPIQHYPTEADLLAATPPDGTLAWGDDTGLVYARSNGIWKRVNSPGISIGTKPAKAGAGDLNYESSRGLRIFDGTNWVDAAPANPVGTIIMFPSWTPPAGYLRCDGGAIPTQYPALRALVGTTTPDLRNQFIRGAAGSGDTAGRTRHQDTTRGPRNPFTGTTASAGNHKHSFNWGGANPVLAESANWFNWGGNTWTNEAWRGSGVSSGMTETGAHTHTFTVSGGGDNETAPAHVRLAYMIKHD